MLPPAGLSHSRPCVGEASGLFFLSRWGWLWQRVEVGVVGAVKQRRGLTTRATFKACTGAGGGEWKATVSWNRPALARQQGPYKEMLFLLSQWDWDRALGLQDRAALVAVGWGCHPPPAEALNGPLLQAQHSLSAWGTASPHSPYPPTP